MCGGNGAISGVKFTFADFLIMIIIEQFIDYIRSVRRYSERTADIYESVLNDFCSDREVSDEADISDLLSMLNPSQLRTYEVNLF